METSPAFFEGKSECRVRVFLESGFCTGPSPVRVSQYAVLKRSNSRCNQGAVKHGRGNGCVTPDLSVMRDPPRILNKDGVGM